LSKESFSLVVAAKPQCLARATWLSLGVDSFARVLFALFGGLFLLLPMIAMAYITSKKYLLVTAVLLVLIFALSLEYFSKGSN